MRQQPHPDVTFDDVQRIVRRDFPTEQFDTVLAALKQYGAEPWQRECARVQLAVLKLSQGRLDALSRHLKTAKRDYRDVLAAAEYPRYMNTGSQIERLSPKEQQGIVDSDWEEYQGWLQRGSDRK